MPNSFKFSMKEISPQLFDGLLAWYDGSVNSTILNNSDQPVSASEEEIKTWQDRSGNGNHAVQSTFSEQPFYNPTLQSVNFEWSSGSNLPISSISIGDLSQGGTIITALNIEENDENPHSTFFSVKYGTDRIIAYGSMDLSGELGDGITVVADRFGASNPSWGNKGTKATNNLTAIFSLKFTRSGTLSNRIDNVEETSRSITGPSYDFRSDDGGTANIGSVVDGTKPADGDFFEVLVYNRELSESEMSDIHLYLKRKWFE